MEPGKRKPPKPQACDAQKKKRQLLVSGENNLMHCKLCEMGNKNRMLQKFSLSFINGSSNYHQCIFESNYEQLPRRKKRNNQQSLGAITNRKKITVPSDAFIRKSIKNVSSIQEDEQDKLKRQIEVSYHLAVNERPSIDFHSLDELEKMHVVKCLKGKSYKNETVCKDFMQKATGCLFQEDLES